MKIVFKYIAKYFTLIGLFILLMLLTKSYGDFYTVLLFKLIVIPFVIFLIIVNFLILYKFEKKRKNTKTIKYTFLVLLFMLSINSLYGYYYTHQKTEMDLRSEDCKLMLFKNGKYRIRIQHPHGTSNYSGKYSFENNILKINDTLIEKKTENRITNEYKFNKIGNYFEPNKKNFEILEVLK